MPPGSTSFSSSSEFSSTSATREFMNTAGKATLIEQSFSHEDVLGSNTRRSNSSSDASGSTAVHSDLDRKPIPPLNLVNLVKAEFGAIDKNRDGKLDMEELVDARFDIKASEKTREAASRVFQKTLMDPTSPNFGLFNFDRNEVSGWEYAIRLHDSESMRRNELYKYTGIGAGAGAATVGLSAMLVTWLGEVGGRASWAVPLACTIAGAVGGGWLGNRIGRAHLDEMDVLYKSLL